MSDHDPQVEFERLMLGMCEGDITPEQLAELGALLEAHPELDDAYLDYVATHGLLREMLETRSTPIALDVPEVLYDDERDAPDDAPHAPVGRVGFAWKRYAAAAVFVIVAGVAAAVYWSAAHGPTYTPAARVGSVATLTDTNRATWTDDGGMLQPGVELGVETLRLESGTAQVAMRSGAVVDVVGPAEFDLRDGNSLGLRRGQLIAHVPHAAAGFRVFGTGYTVTDLGTRFLLIAHADRSADLLVLEGKVELAAGTTDAVALVAGESRRIGPDGAVTPAQLALGTVDVDFDVSNGPMPGKGAEALGADKDRWNSVAVQSGRIDAQALDKTMVDAAGRPSPVRLIVESNGRLNAYAERGASKPVRRDVVFVTRGDVQKRKDPIAWRIEGLLPNTPYELALLGQWEDKRGGAVNPAVFTVQGVTAELDANNDAVFTGDSPNGHVVSDAHGVIHGTLGLRDGEQFAGWSGLQVRGPIDYAPIPTSNDAAPSAAPDGGPR
ncbi:MAG: hypothetical protein GC159_21150 [Phycisphaera sp.]|nr:hypothetical protein [Phycisphaera sp.]